MDMTQPHTRAELDAWVSQQGAARAAETDQKSFLDRIGAGSNAQTGAQTVMAESPIGTFVRHIPQNVTVGAITAGISAADKINSLDEWLATPADYRLQQERHPETATAAGSGPVALPPLIPTQALDALRKWHDSILPDNENMGDTLTQAAGQFALPGFAFAKVFGLGAGASALSNIGRAAATEVATSVAAQPSHSVRGSSELLQLGLQAENRFGDLLRAADSSGALLTRYVNWMSNPHESALEGEFKNAVDFLSLAGTLNGVIKSSAMVFHGSRGLLDAAGAELSGGGPVGASAQRGAVTLGTPKTSGYLYRGTQPGVNPLEPRNRAGALFYTPKEAEAYDYGTLVHRADMPKAAFDAGSLPDFLKSQGVDPTRAGHQDALMEALSNYATKKGSAPWLRFTYPLAGNPAEYVHFPALASKP